MAKATIHGAEYAIKDIFSDRFVFNIPRYQRPYLWEWEEHAETLFDDLVSFMKDDNTPVKEMNPYFLGSIVLKKEDNEPEADVIDGQQRLITLTILLSALRTSVNEEYANAITEYLYDPANLIEGTPARYRLEIRDKDADYFRKNIQDESKILDAKNEDTTKLSDARKNIIINAKNYLEKIDELSADKRVRLAKFIANQCYIVVVSTTQLESAYRVFSILNDRGLELSVTDILKAEMIGEISEEKQDHYTEEWENKEVSLGRDSFERLFSHIRMIELKRKMGDSVLKEFRTDITPKKYKPITFIDEVLTPYAEAFVMMTPPTYEAEELSEEINEKLKWLNRIDNSDWVPPSLLYMSKFVNQPKKILRFFTKLERLAAGMMIVRDNVNKRIERYATILTEIESGANLFLKGSPLNLSKEEQKSIICKLDSDIYLITRIRKFVLLRLDYALSSGGATYDYPIITVEHVLPQNPAPESEWLELFPNEDIFYEYVHRLGNLVLLPRRKNSQAQNFEFEKKKEKYFTTAKGISPFVLTTQVLQEDEWSPEVIERRQAAALDVLKQEWDLNS